MIETDKTVSILRWSYFHAALMLLTLFLLWHFTQPLLLVAVAALSIGWYLYSERLAYRGFWLGIGRANALSLFRFFLLSLVVMLFSQIPALLAALVLIMCVILDGIDGSLARRYHESGDFGHYLDVEIDAFGIAALSVLLWYHESITSLILLAAALRYAYVWLIRFTVSEQKLEPRRRYASVIAVTVYVVMSVRLAFDHAFFSWILAISCALLLASFARSLAFQWRN